MLRSHKIALRPTDHQRRWFAMQCGYSDVAYNFALSAWNAGVPKSQLRKTFNARKCQEFQWCEEMDQRAAMYGIMNLEDAITRYNKGQNNRPKRKKRGSRQSYQMESAKIQIDAKRVKLPKIGWIQMHEEVRFKGEVVNRVTISRTAHRWFISVTVETEDIQQVVAPTAPVIGIDVGINTLATLDDGRKFDNPRPLKCYKRKLAREQRKLSRMRYQSNNYYKQKLKVEKIHYRIRCIREDAHHQATTAILKRASKVGIETLKVTNMLKNRKLAKALSDSALGGFLTKLKYKADCRGIPVTEAPQFFASSKTCSHCGHKKVDLTLSKRIYHCNECGFECDRDLNAAINLCPT